MGKKLEKIRNRLIAPMLGLLLAITATLAPLSAPSASAVPSTPETTPVTVEPPTTTPADTPETTPEDSENTENAESDGENLEGATCFSQVGALGWLLCPATGLLAKGIDFLYGLIEELLIVEPVNMEQNSPVYVVWSYMRNITNVVFVIFLLIIIYSQITGLGINNYGIKKSLPRLVIVAILVNISFAICALAVDISNVIGISLRDMLTGVGENAIASGALEVSVNLNVYDLFVAIAGGGVIAGLGIAIAGGALQLLLALIPVILGGILAVLVGLATISLRQAVIVVLVTISPLALVAFLLPNTEKWYQKWFNLFMQMLVFYPMFSLLFGVSRLAGWIFIAGAGSALGVILGIAIQILPLFLAVSLMKMSGTVLGAVSGALAKLGDKATGAARAYIDPYKNAKRAEKIARHTNRPFNPLSGGSWLAHRNSRDYSLKDRTRVAEETAQYLNEEQLQALKRGSRIIGYNRQTGEAIYTQRPLAKQSGLRAGHILDRRAEHLMTAESINRIAKMRATDAKLRTDNVHAVTNDFIKEHGITEGEIVGTAPLSGKYFFRIDQATREKNNQDLADQREVMKKYLGAMERDPISGKLLRPDEYADVIQSALGADGFKVNQLTEEGRRNAFVSEADFIGAIHQTNDALHDGHTQRAQAYLNRQVTNIVDKYYKQSLEHKDTDNIIAATSTLGMRGDYDKVKENLIPYFNSGNVDLTTDQANRLAFHFLQMKDGDPSLARFGKFINMETWAYTSGRRQEQTVTYDQFDTGYVQITNPDGTKGFLYETDAAGNVKLDSDGNKILYRTKVNLATALAGTSLNNIDRTFFGSLSTELQNITQDKLPEGISVKDVRNEVNRNLMPQIISALPTFLSGSEQIRTMVGYLTGQKWKNEQWVDDIMSNDTIIDKQLEQEIMKDTYQLYLKSLTPRNLIDIKSDTWAALNARIQHDAKVSNATFAKDTFNPLGELIANAGTLVYDESRSAEENKKMAEEYSHAILRDLLAGPIDKLATGSLSIENMKLPIREALGINELRNRRRKDKQQILNRAAGIADEAEEEIYDDYDVETPAGNTGRGPRHADQPRRRSSAQSDTHDDYVDESHDTGGYDDYEDTPRRTRGGTPRIINERPGDLPDEDDGGISSHVRPNTAYSARVMEMIQALNEIAHSTTETMDKFQQFMQTLERSNASSDEIDDVAKALDEMKENETDQRKIRLLQDILDKLNAMQEGRDTGEGFPDRPIKPEDGE